MLEDVGLSLNLLKIFVQHCATLLAQQCCTMLASSEQALTNRKMTYIVRSVSDAKMWREKYKFSQDSTVYFDNIFVVLEDVAH